MFFGLKGLYLKNYNCFLLYHLNLFCECILNTQK